MCSLLAGRTLPVPAYVEGEPGGMSTLMKLLEDFYSLQDAAREDGDYEGSHVYDVAVDLADGMSKGVLSSVWLRQALQRNADSFEGAEATAYGIAVMLVDEYLAARHS